MRYRISTVFLSNPRFVTHVIRKPCMTKGIEIALSNVLANLQYNCTQIKMSYIYVLLSFQIKSLVYFVALFLWIHRHPLYSHASVMVAIHSKYMSFSFMSPSVTALDGRLNVSRVCGKIDTKTYHLMAAKRKKITICLDSFCIYINIQK